MSGTASSASGAFHKNCLVTYVSGPAMLDEQHGMGGCRGRWNSGIPDGLALRTASSRWHQPQRQLPPLVATPAIYRQANTQVGVTNQHSVSHAEEVKMIISHFFIVFFILLFYALRNCFQGSKAVFPQFLPHNEMIQATLNGSSQLTHVALFQTRSSQDLA